MEEDGIVSIDQANCNHAKERHYTQREFDVLNGFELRITRCINCHKTLTFEAKRIGANKT